jgi:galactokinase
VNLIGEHTDYNDGFALPMAIDRGVTVTFRARDDRTIRAHSALDGASCGIALDDLDVHRGRGWESYVAGVAWAMQRHGHELRGADLDIESDLPAGAGLSSSAALEVAVYRALAAVSGIAWDPVEAARQTRHAENQFVGVGCGVMDQMAAAASLEGHAMLIDCRSLAIDHVVMPSGAAIVVIDTGVRRRLAVSEYTARQASCERAVQQLKRHYPRIRALRDVVPAELNEAIDQLGATEWMRASHVVAENQRVLAAVHALATGDLATVGALFVASHESLRDLFEVSSPELDAAVDCAMSHPACHGARMTGAGFGGCAIALVRHQDAADFVQTVRERLPVRIPACGEVFMVRASAGAGIENRHPTPGI